jgi:hypothetical protein
MPSGGKRQGAGRKALPRAQHSTGLEKFAWIIEELNKEKTKPELKKESGELKKWRLLWEAKDLRIRLDARKFVYDHAYGKATQPVDHGAGGPIKVEITTNVKMPNPNAR